MNSYELDQPLDLRLKALNLSRGYNTQYPPTIEEVNSQPQKVSAPVKQHETGPSNMLFSNYYHPRENHYTHHSHQRSVRNPPPPRRTSLSTQPGPYFTTQNPVQYPDNKGEQQPHNQAKDQHNQQQYPLTQTQEPVSAKVQTTITIESQPKAISAASTLPSAICPQNSASLSPILNPATFSSHVSRPTNQSAGNYRPSSVTSWSSTSISSDTSSTSSSSSSSSSEVCSMPIVRQQSLSGRYHCKPCGIVFSQLDNLKAHQVGYCTKTNRQLNK